MTLILTPPSLTRFYNAEGYAKSSPVDLSNTPFQGVPNGLLVWLETQIEAGECISQVILEDAGRLELPDDLVRKIINAAVSIDAQFGNGQRSIAISSESLPVELRDGMLSVWEHVNGLE